MNQTAGDWRWFEMFFNTVLCSSLKTGKTSGLPWFCRIERVGGCGSALLMIWWSYLPKIQNSAPDSYPLSINRSGPRDSFIIRNYSFFTWMASLISCSNWQHLCFVVHKLRMNFMWCKFCINSLIEKFNLAPLRITFVLKFVSAFSLRYLKPFLWVEHDRWIGSRHVHVLLHCV